MIMRWKEKKEREKEKELCDGGKVNCKETRAKYTGWEGRNSQGQGQPSGRLTGTKCMYRWQDVLTLEPIPYTQLLYNLQFLCCSEILFAVRYP